jgi:tetratricopeptide (TPR) repeat protein
MGRLRNKFLNVPLSAVLHPASPAAQQAVQQQKAAAEAAPAVQKEELTAQQWFERGFSATDPDETIRSYTEAIRLKPDYAEAFNNRGNARRDKGDLGGAIEDYSEAIRLKPDFAQAFNNRGVARGDKGDVEEAAEDFKEAERLQSALRVYENLLRLGILRIPSTADMMIIARGQDFRKRSVRTIFRKGPNPCMLGEWGLRETQRS